MTGRPPRPLTLSVRAGSSPFSDTSPEGLGSRSRGVQPQRQREPEPASDELRQLGIATLTASENGSKHDQTHRSPAYFRQNGIMIAVVLDTNAVHRDASLSSEAAKNLLALGADGSCEIVYTEVVLEELKRQQFERLQKLQADADALTKTMSRDGEPMDSITAQLDTALTSLESKIKADFEMLFSRTGVVREPVPKDVAERLLRRDLERRRPFLEVGNDQVSAGFRDAVIWESVLALLQDDRGYDKVLLVTQDKGFLVKSGGLHQHLLDDLDSLSVDRKRVIAVKTVFDAVGRVRAQIEATVEATENALFTSIATDAILDLVNQSVSMEMVYGGEYDYPDFVKFTTGPLEDATIDDIDQQTDFVFTRNEGAGTVTATAEAHVYLSGFVMKSEWHADESSVTVVQDWNDHYFHASDEAVVQAVVEIDVSGPTPEAVGVELRDLNVVGSIEAAEPGEAPINTL